MLRKKHLTSAARIRQAVNSIEARAPQLQSGFTRQEKKALEDDYGTLACHAPKLALQLKKLSTYFDAGEYLSAARNVIVQLIRFEHLMQQPAPLKQGVDAEEEGPLRWAIQPEESPEIDYLAFQVRYGFARSEIEWLEAFLRVHYPRVPVQNWSVEWAVLKQREMEAQDDAQPPIAPKPDLDSWLPPDPPPWWVSPAGERQRLAITLAFSEWLRETYPLFGRSREVDRVAVQLEALVESALRRFPPPDRHAPEWFLDEIHLVGALASLALISDGHGDLLGRAWKRLEEEHSPLEVFVVTAATYYERLAEREAPIRDDPKLAVDLFASGSRGEEPTL